MLINAYYRFYICITDDLHNKYLLRYYFKNSITKHCPIEQGKWRKKNQSTIISIVFIYWAGQKVVRGFLYDCMEKPTLTWPSQYYGRGQSGLYRLSCCGLQQCLKIMLTLPWSSQSSSSLELNFFFFYSCINYSLLRTTLFYR